MANYRATRALLGKGRNVGEGAAGLSKSSAKQCAVTGITPMTLNPPSSPSLPPGPYTAILAGKNSGTGVGLVEVYDLDSAANSRLGNISTRSFVRIGNNVMIGGFILGSTRRVLVRALGPSLTGAGISEALANPLLELHGPDGTIIATNDDWKQTLRAEIKATDLASADDKESALLQTLPTGSYTAIVRGVNETIGVALVEVYSLD